MKKSIRQFLLCLLLLIATALPAVAQFVTLTWDQNTEPEVIGYNVYYRADTATFPFDGTGLLEGDSPIFVDGATTTSLEMDLPEDGSIYYFTATAISSAGLESDYSEIIASEWVPYLLAPTNNAVVGTAVTFAWNLPPESYNVSFDLYYGTDPNLVPNTMAFIAPGTFSSNWPQFKLNVAVPLAILLSLLLAISTGRAKRFWRPVRVGLCLGVFVLQVSCGSGGGGGGGGGGGDDAAVVPDTEVPSAVVPSEVAPEPPATPFTNVVPDIYGTEYQITDLQPDTKYYWKIVAVDNWGNTYESITQEFTTLGD